MVRLNCEAVLDLTARWLPEMKERDTGGFIQVASVLGGAPIPMMACYSSTKAFVLNLSLALAEEVRGTRVRMMALVPGTVPTQFLQRASGAGVRPPPGSMSAERLVTAALKAYERGHATCSPGLINGLALGASGAVPKRVAAMAARQVMALLGRA
jgi:short-subunit dehydrogenase